MNTSPTPPPARCPHDTDGDGNCHLCAKHGGCQGFTLARARDSVADSTMAESTLPVLPLVRVSPWEWHAMATKQPEPPQMTREVLVVLDGSPRDVPDTIAVGWRMINSAGRPTGWWQVNGSACKEDRLKFWAELPAVPFRNKRRTKSHKNLPK